MPGPYQVVDMHIDAQQGLAQFLEPLARRDAECQSVADPIAGRADDWIQLTLRYYDSRIVSIYLPTCTAQFSTVHGSFATLVAEEPVERSMRMFGLNRITM